MAAGHAMSRLLSLNAVAMAWDVSSTNPLDTPSTRRIRRLVTIALLGYPRFWDTRDAGEGVRS